MSSHEYARENYLRVTNILYPFSGLQKIDPKIVEKAAERGTRVHRICEGIVAGLGEFDVDDEVRGYVESFKFWWQEKPEIVAMEERFYDDELHITGQVDFIVKTSKGLAVVDIKTSYKPSKTWPVQGNAYAHLAKLSGYDIKKIQFLHLNKYGSNPKIYDYPVDNSFFLATVKVHDYFFK